MKKTLKTVEETIRVDQLRRDKNVDSNALVLPGTKAKRRIATKSSTGHQPRQKKLRKVVTQKQQKLSKKKQRKLDSIVNTKNKKEQRASLLAELQKYQQVVEIPSKASKVTDKTDRLPRRLKSVRVPPTDVATQPVQWQSTAHFETDSESDSESTSDNDLVQSEAPDTEQVLDNYVKNKDEIILDDDDVKGEVKPATTSVDDGSDDERDTAPIESAPDRQRVLVQRACAIDKCRHLLPILADEQRIVEVVIVCGATGSGKSTQVPQMLYEAGYTNIIEDGVTCARRIAITQPRRVAAVSMAVRVGEELAEPSTSHLVAHHIRFDTSVDAASRIVFMTDGVLLRHMQNDIALDSYSVVIVDEAHERSVSSDILIGLLSRVVRMRRRRGRPLKLVIMSATLRVSDFQQTHLFAIPPAVLTVDSRQHAVTMYFDRRTRTDYIDAAFEKTVKVHCTLPAGAILVFVTGQREVHQLVRALQRRFANRNDSQSVKTKELKRSRSSKTTRTTSSTKKIRLADYDKKVEPKITSSLVDGVDADELGEDLCFSDDDEDEIAFASTQGGDEQPLHVLPLYSLMPMHEQCRIFEPPPAGARLCVVCTNVAETSLTIPDVRYVIDTGRCKTRVRDPVTGVSRFVVSWTSKASADQRAGRAGRTSAGHCYRLYSSAMFNDSFAAHNPPDIVNKPVDELLLHMHAMNIVHTRRFPFISPPPPAAVDTAEQRLVRLGAINSGDGGFMRITSLGRTLALLPVAPAYGKVLVLAEQRATTDTMLLPYAICLVAALSVREPFLPLLIDPAAAQQRCVNAGTSCMLDTCGACSLRRRLIAQMAQRKVWLRRGHEARQLGDLMLLLCAYLQAESGDLSADVCDRLGVRRAAMMEVRQQRRQLTNVLNSQCVLTAPLCMQQHLPLPDEQHCRLIRQCFVAALADNIAIRACLVAGGDETQTTSPSAYRTHRLTDVVYTEPTSALHRSGCDYVLYQQVLDNDGGHKVMRTVCAVEVDWIAALAPQYCSFGDVDRTADEYGPVYSREHDAVVQLRRTTLFGWPLASAWRPIEPPDLLTYVHFARALLDGVVCATTLAPLRPHWLVSATSIERQLVRRSPGGACVRNKADTPAHRLLLALVGHQVLSERRLLQLCEEDKSFLLKELSDLLPESIRDQLLLVWPPTRVAL